MWKVPPRSYAAELSLCPWGFSGQNGTILVMAWTADTPQSSSGRRRIRKARRIASLLLAGALVGALSVTPALAISDSNNVVIPNTSTASPTAQQTGATSVTQLLGTPFSQPRPGSVGSPNSPEEDLAEILNALAGETDLPTANALRQRVLDILEGNPVAGAAYSGIGLLNTNPNPATGKVKTVAAGGTVVVNIVRFGEHEISDTWQLDFADPNQPFSIDYRVTELGGSDGGEFTPTPLLEDAANPANPVQAGMHSIVADLAVGETNLGTFQGSRFVTARGLADQPEHTRLATQRLIVKMPPPKFVSAILDPNLRQGHEALSTLRPLGTAPAITIQEIAVTAPERQLWEAMQSDFADIGSANLAGAGGKSLLAAMRVKSHLPAGVAADPAADVTIAFINNEVYVSDTNLQLAPSANLTVTVINQDGFAHSVQGLGLKKADPVFGATNWGEFDWERYGAVASLAAGATQTFTYSVSSNAFELVVGDPTSGDQATTAIALDRAPIQESFRVPGPAFSMPLHEAFDASGNIWLTLAGADKIAKLTPASKLSESTFVEFNLPVPPGTPVNAPVGFFEPLDIAVDAQGIIWATLPVGNAIARLDPALAHPGTSDGIEIHPLAACPPTECRTPPPPVVPGAPLSREPTQMALRTGADGSTEVWFTELFADKVGVVKRLASGTYVEQHFTCACKVPGLGVGNVPSGTPLGIDVDEAGKVWFTASNKNTIGRMTPGLDPFASTIIQTEHFTIPSGITIDEPDIGGTFVTSIPHSVSVAPDGKVWFTEQATRKVGWLDPGQAVAGTTQGMHEILIGLNEFGARTQPADLTVDPAGTVFVTDEYGDQVTALTTSGIKAKYRPTERVSLTDQPLTDAAGNLWFLEAGANLVTRIKGVAATQRPQGPPDPGPGPGPTPPPSGGNTGTPSSLDPVAAACKAKQWSFGTKSAPRVLLLGNTPAQVTSCLGKPTAKKGSVWTYGPRLKVTFKAGKVTTFTVLNAAFRSSVAKVGVGSPVSALTKLSTAKVSRNGKTGDYSTVMPLGGKQGAKVTFTVTKKKVTRITVTLVKTAK